MPTQDEKMLVTDSILRVLVMSGFSACFGLQIKRAYDLGHHKNAKQKYAWYARLVCVFFILAGWIQVIDPYTLWGTFSRAFIIDVISYVYLCAVWVAALLATLHYVQVLLDIQKVVRSESKQIRTDWMSYLVYAAILTQTCTIISLPIRRAYAREDKSLNALNKSSFPYLISSSVVIVGLYIMFIYICWTLYALIRESQNQTTSASNSTTISNEAKKTDPLEKAKKRILNSFISCTVISIMVFYLHFPDLFSDIYPADIPFGFPMCKYFGNIALVEYGFSDHYNYLTDCSGEKSLEASNLVYDFYDFWFMSSSPFLGAIYVIPLTWISSDRTKAARDARTRATRTTISSAPLKHAPSSKLVRPSAIGMSPKASNVVTATDSTRSSLQMPASAISLSSAAGHDPVDEQKDKYIVNDVAVDVKQDTLTLPGSTVPPEV